MGEVQHYWVGENDIGKRLDLFLTEAAVDYSRSQIQKLITDGLATINGNMVKAGYKIREGDLVRLKIPGQEKVVVKPEKIPLEIYYEDRDLMVINKPRGMVVHPGAGHYSGTLVNALLYYTGELSRVNGEMRPGIVHRLDKDTSGLLMVAKNDAAHISLAQQLKDRSASRIYLALAHGEVRDARGVIDAPIGRDPRNRQKMAVVYKGSRPAVTIYQVRDRYRGYTYLQLKLETGRTHQIRVHLAFIGHPIVGDPRYGPAKPHFHLSGQFLHATTIGFKHPRTAAHMEFTAPLPGELATILADLAAG
ncbi:MAG: RluA family pseudouridine synthase [Peptococcaceae bacterium]|nr:RluA family pseudouridine synthase [Peptococcaceae bacterium]